MAKRQGKATKTRAWKRKAKELRKNNKMWAEGARESLMRPHIEAYADALERGWRAERDYLQKVCNEYHACISWRLADHEEPALPLPVYDPFAPPVPEPLDESERALKHEAIKTLNERIRRWLKYRARSLRHGLASDKGMHDNPFAVLLAKLSGLTTPPKARQAYQQYMHESYASDIAPVVTERWMEKSINPDGSANTKKPNAPFRSAVARDLFAALPQEEQDRIATRAKEEAKQAKLDYAKGMKEGPSKSPEARQRCIDGFGRFMAPIMRGLHEYTGLKGYIVLGGPIPRYDGEIGTVHLSVGTNLASVPTPFPNWDKPRWAREVIGFLKEYLATAFTAEDCSEAALPSTEPLKAGLFTFESDNSDSDASDSDSSSSSSSSDDEEEEEEEDEDGSGEEGEGVVKGKEKARKKAEKEKAREEGGEGERKGKGKAAGTATGRKKRKRAEDEEAGGAKRAKTSTRSKAGEGDNSDREEDEVETVRRAEEEARRADEEARIEEGRRYAAQRNANIARNDELLSLLKLKGAASLAGMGIELPGSKKQTAVPKRVKKPAVNGPRRRSTRGTNRGEGVGPDEDDGGGDGGGEEEEEEGEGLGVGG
ncbi:hypothetical protein C8F04DRAFT_1279934 [Mycena alexandri]|uniref:Uncharacterized protein n=1 Tax=Mycena alexandri TaxID=1745969 RepID=A0AAD6WQF6_9AGAR|nr:hypothetical protein C8F04DRAFT_1279934 [Mycena alexandri]